jgi:hypothetical protein
MNIDSVSVSLVSLCLCLCALCSDRQTDTLNLSPLFLSPAHSVRLSPLSFYFLSSHFSLSVTLFHTHTHTHTHTYTHTHTHTQDTHTHSLRGQVPRDPLRASLCLLDCLVIYKQERAPVVSSLPTCATFREVPRPTLPLSPCRNTSFVNEEARELEKCATRSPNVVRYNCYHLLYYIYFQHLLNLSVW